MSKLQPRLTPTPEQAAAIAIAKSGRDLFLTARAGTGKTATLELITRALGPSVEGVALTFSKAGTEALAARLPKTWTAVSYNAIGFRTWAASRGGVSKWTVSDDKLRKALDLILQASNLSLPREAKSAILAVVARAKIVGHVPDLCTLKHTSLSPFDWHAELLDTGFLEASDYHVKLARALLLQSIKEAHTGILDFNDQPYMPVCFPSIWARPPIVLVDETQDLNAVNIAITQKLNPRQLIVVGDDLQAIYGFRGADADAMNRLRSARENRRVREGQPAPQPMLTSSLTVSFRCSQEVIREAQRYAPDIRALQEAPTGAVAECPSWNPLTLPSGSAVLCRNNAPLAKIALHLLRAGQPVRMLGQDFGKTLQSDAKTALAGHRGGPGQSIPKAILAYFNKRLSRLADNDAPAAQLASLRDRRDALAALSAGYSTPAALLDGIGDLFSSQSPASAVVLSTIHKAKGLEWPHVFFLEAQLIPAIWVKNEAEVQQELNLLYVGITRAKLTLSYVTLEGCGLGRVPQ